MAQLSTKLAQRTIFAGDESRHKVLDLANASSKCSFSSLADLNRAEVVRDPGQKAGLVLEGDVVIVVGSEEMLLHEGDSFQFDSTIEHSIRNDEDRHARVLWITALANIVSGF
jgi:hypothetical protein